SFSFFFFSSRRRHTRFSRDWSSECALPIFPKGRASRHTPYIARSCVILAAPQFGNHIVQPPFDRAVPACSIHQRQRCEVMATDMPIEATVFPVPVACRLWFKPRFPQEGCQQAIHIQRHQVFPVAVLRLLERSVQQTHIPQREKTGCISVHIVWQLYALMRGFDRQNTPFRVKSQSVHAYLAIVTRSIPHVNAVRITESVIYDIPLIGSRELQHRVVSSAVDAARGILGHYEVVPRYLDRPKW